MDPYEDRILRRSGETWPRARNPPGWSQSRSDICDATPWFKSYQGGVYLSPINGPVMQHFRGLLISGFAGPRAYMDAEILITQINGEQGASLTSPETQRRHRAMEWSINQKNLIGVIADRGSAGWESQAQAGNRRRRGDDQQSPQLFPVSNMPIQDQPNGHSGQACWTLDFFLPIAMWAERVPGSANGRIWCVKLEKYHLDQQSWWANTAHGHPPSNADRNFSIVAHQETCLVCLQQSPRMYEEFFICLNDACPELWKNDGQIIPRAQQLTYTKEFLQERTQRPVPGVEIPVLIDDFQTWWNDHWYLPASRQKPLSNENMSERMTDLKRAFCCPYCGMFNRRVQWHRWHCRNKRCNSHDPFALDGYPRLLSVPEVQSLGVQNPLPDFTRLRGYQQTLNLPHFIAHRYNLGPGCNLAYMLPKPGTNAMAGGSDHLYRRMQELAINGTIPLRRHAMNTAAGAALTGHFAANYGKAYLFTARVGTVAFDDPQCPPEVNHAVGLTNGWVAPFRNHDEEGANEMYLAGYYYEQEMHWHDDGEIGLQHVVTTHTLGGQGNFRVCIKPRYQYGRYGKNASGRWIDWDPVIPGCYKERERLALNVRRRSGELDEAGWLAEFQNLMAGRPSSGMRPVLLDLPVNHGALIVMYGSHSQVYLEHAAGVETPMRFALTFRHIMPNHYGPNFDMEAMRRKIAYDLQYDPGEDWTNPPVVDAQTHRSNTPLPGLMEEDGGPPPKRQRLDSHDAWIDDDEDFEDHHEAARRRRGGGRGRGGGGSGGGGHDYHHQHHHHDNDDDSDPMQGVQQTNPQTRSQSQTRTRRRTPGPSTSSSRRTSRPASRTSRTSRQTSRQPSIAPSASASTGSQPTGIRRSSRNRR